MYSDRYRTVFVHIPKTAGQSIEHVFLDKHGLSWAERASLLLRAASRNEDRGPARLAHLYAREYVALGYLSPETFASCFKFATVRNPYDRALSAYRYISRTETFDRDQFLRLLETSDAKRHFVPQSEFVADGNGALIVDFVIRFEALQDGFDDVSRRVFGQSVPLPLTNQSQVSLGSDVLDRDSMGAIYKRYERDFDLFNYPRASSRF